MNLYMSAHSEKFRDKFVEFDGREKIVVEGDSWESMITSFGDELNNRVKTKWLKDWILPNFSTDRKSTRLNSSHANESRMPSSA